MDFEHWNSLLEEPRLRQTISLDWLELFLIPSNETKGSNPSLPGFIIPTPRENERQYEISDSVSLLLEPYGTQLYSNKWKLLVYGEEFGYLLTHPRRMQGSVKPSSMSLKVANHQLYTAGLIETLLEALAGLNAEIHNVSRLDIAVDGTNEVRDFLNAYTKQEAESKGVHMKGRAKFSGLWQCHNTMSYDRFLIGSAKSGKQISVYNKTAELETSNKKYIQNTWKLAGMDTTGTVYRTELRLKSEAIKEIKDFDFMQLENPAYLASIFKTQSNNFFQFTRFSDDSNISRQEVLDPLNYSQFGGAKLDKLRKAKTTDRYKVKLGAHLTVKNVLKGQLTEIQEVCQITNLPFQLHQWDLMEWYDKMLPYWTQAYTRGGLLERSVKPLASLQGILTQRPSQNHDEERQANRRWEDRNKVPDAEGTEELNRYLDKEASRLRTERTGIAIPEAIPERTEPAPF